MSDPLPKYDLNPGQVHSFGWPEYYRQRQADHLQHLSEIVVHEILSEIGY